MMKMLNKKFIFIAVSSFSFIFATFQIESSANQLTNIQYEKDILLTQTTINQEEAKSIALKQVKGRVIHVDLDTDNGVSKYEVIILTDQNKVYEVEINANTGQVIKVEQENDID